MNEPANNANQRGSDQSIGKTVAKLAAAVVGMFAFAFALVPLYDLLCDLTGLNGRTNDTAYEYDAAMVQADTSRLIKVNFVTNTNQGMPWKFWSEKGGMRVHPGDPKTVNFYVKNTTDKVMVGQAIPSVVPGRAAAFFHKTECFCFEQQVLAPGEEMEMPMRFLVGPEVPKNVESISLSYALFDVTDTVSESVLAKAETAAQTQTNGS